MPYALGICLFLALAGLSRAQESQMVVGRLAPMGHTTHPVHLETEGGTFLLRGWSAEMAAVARDSNLLKDLVGERFVVECRPIEGTERELRLVRLLSPLPFEPETVTVDAAGSRLTRNGEQVPFFGPVSDLLAWRAAGREVTIRGLAFKVPGSETTEKLFVTGVQGKTGWYGALLRNARGDWIGLVPPDSEVWLLGSTDDGRVWTRDGIQIRPQYEEEPHLPWWHVIPVRVDRYAPAERFVLGRIPPPASAESGGLQGAVERSSDE
jgi:hypothetical protein